MGGKRSKPRAEQEVIRQFGWNLAGALSGGKGAKPSNPGSAPRPSDGQR